MSVLLLRAAALRLVASADVTGGKWSLLFPRGEYHGPNLKALGGKVVLDDIFFADVIASWEAQGRPSLPVYWHHPPRIDEVPPEKRKEVFRAAGHIEDFRVTDAGLEGRTSWSAEGQAAVSGDEYRFWSAEWQRGYLDRHTGEVVKRWCVTGAALTDTPFFNEMPRVAASAAPTQSGPAPQEQSNMDKKLICAALGLPESTSDDAVMAALTAACNKAKGSISEQDVGTRVTAAVAPVEKALASAQAALAEESKAKAGVQAELEKLKADGRAKEKDAFLASLSGFGAASRQHVGEVWDAMGADKAKAIASSMKPTVDTTEKGVPGTTDAPTPQTALAQLQTEADRLVASGTPRQDALIRAMQSNPKLALVAEGK